MQVFNFIIRKYGNDNNKWQITRKLPNCLLTSQDGIFEGRRTTTTDFVLFNVGLRRENQDEKVIIKVIMSIYIILFEHALYFEMHEAINTPSMKSLLKRLSN